MFKLSLCTKSCLLALSIATAGPIASAASYEFTWTGGGGYSMQGALSIPDDLASAEIVTQRNVECFRITGFKDGKPVGFWSLGQMTFETNWVLNFEPKGKKFRTGGPWSSGPNGQEWNMNGRGVNCGAGGFGFNIGGAAQDICINNRLIWASQVAPATQLKAKRNDAISFDVADCAVLSVS